MRVRFGFRLQLLSVVVILMLPAPLMMRSYLSTAAHQIDLARTEQQGLELARPFLDVVIAVEDARFDVARDEVVSTERRERLAVAVDAVDRDLAADFGLGEAWSTLADELLGLADAPAGDRVAQLVAWDVASTKVVDFTREVARASQLLLDPEVTTDALMVLVTMNDLEMVAAAGDARSNVALAAVASSYRDLGALASAASDLDAAAGGGIGLAAIVDDGVPGAAIGATNGTVVASGAELAAEARAMTEVFKVEPDDVDRVAGLATTIIDGVLVRHGAAADLFALELDDRRRSLEQARFGALAAVGATMLLGGLALVTFFVRTSRTIGRLADASDLLTTSSASLGRAATEMHGSVSDAGTRTGSAVEAVGNVDGFAQMVAAGNDQMQTSIAEVARGASHAVSVSSRAVEIAGDADVAVGELGRAATDIGGVIEMIDSIANETNLLALNAAIEAARAGEAGRGFAVVANEVKELATGTSRATGDIGVRVEAMQSSMVRAQKAIESIVEIVHEIEESQKSIASSAEEQSVTTSEMAHSMRELADQARSISDDIQGVGDAMGHAATSAESTHTASLDLETLARNLDDLVARLR